MFHNDEYDYEDDDPEQEYSLRQIVSSIVLTTWGFMVFILVCRALWTPLFGEMMFLRAIIPGAWGP